MYQPFSRAKFDSTERDLWFQELVEHIRPQAESQPYVTDLARAAELPEQARALYFLWIFQAEVGGNGIECFLLEPSGHFAPQAHEALRLVGASELVARLEAGIPHALGSGCAEFSVGSDLAWFRQFQPSIGGRWRTRKTVTFKHFQEPHPSAPKLGANARKDTGGHIAFNPIARHFSGKTNSARGH